MARKPKKGYFVKGQFVAEGSEEDLALKREAKGNEGTSKTDLKRESVELQKLGEDLMGLRSALMLRLTSQGHVGEKLSDALVHARQITNFEGRRRQMQFIGKLMRKLDEPVLDAIRAALVAQHTPSALETETLHQAEIWRSRLIADEDALGQWINLSPRTDSQQLRALVRQARKDAVPEKPGLAPRHGRAYREIFQLVRAQLAGDNAQDDEAPLPTNPATDV